MKKALALFLALCMAVVSVSALAESAADAAPAATEAASQSSGLPEGLTYQPITLMYVDDDGTLQRAAQNGIFEEGDNSVLYMSVGNFYYGLKYFGANGMPTVTVDEQGLTAIRPNGSTLTISREDNVFFFSDVDLYNAGSFAVNGGDLVSIYPYQTDDDDNILYGDDGQPLVNVIARGDSSVSYSRTGSPVGGDLDDYYIRIYWTENDLYMPLAVLNNLFRAGSYMKMIYLDSVVYVFSGETPDTSAQSSSGYVMSDYYFDTPVGDRPAKLTALNYNLLCLELDLYYGLATEHGIGYDFDTFLENVGLTEQMLTLDGQSFHQALATLTRSYFADFHSGVSYAGPYSGNGYTYKPSSVPASTRTMLETMDRFADARNASDLVEKSEDDEGNVTYTLTQFYQEVGDTAYITFDKFDLNGSGYYSEDYKANLTDYISTDNIALISYANSQIKREGSPIRRVVIDLSNNGGGAVDSAVFLVSWVLGSCSFSVTNPITGASYTTLYQADVDLDGKLTENDYLDCSQYELYCLTSMHSFSCGNLCPALFKESGKVTMLGQTTGGGTCCVQSSITADGTMFSYSGNYRMCTVKNGTYYSIDQGVTPDFVIRQPAHFYDRQWLTDYIATLP